MKRIMNIALTALLLLACGNNRAAHKTTADARPVADTLSSLELPLPDVPSTLTEPSARAAFIIEHYWEAMDFRDTLRSYNADFIEQNFANFISVFPYAAEDAQRRAVATLLRKAEADSTAYVLLTDTAEKYLYDPNSPMLSEDIYILFLEQMVDSPILGEYGTIRPRWQLDAARKNRPGMRAADFAYVTREGKRTTLRETRSSGDLLLIFYDPDCGHCKEIMTGLWEDEMLKEMVSEGEITVLAVHSGEQRELWQSTASQLPSNWNVGYESGLLQENGSYVLRAMPTLYLLDADKKVVLKDVLPEQLFYYLYSRR